MVHRRNLELPLLLLLQNTVHPPRQGLLVHHRGSARTAREPTNLQFAPFCKDPDLTVEIFANLQGHIAQTIPLALADHLVMTVLEAKLRLLAQAPVVMPGEDSDPTHRDCAPPGDGHLLPERELSKFRIMLQPKAIQPRIGLLRRIQTRQTHLSHQTRLQRAETALHSPFACGVSACIGATSKVRRTRPNWVSWSHGSFARVSWNVLWRSVYRQPGRPHSAPDIRASFPCSSASTQPAPDATA